MTQLIGTEISALEPAGTLSGDEVIPGDQSGRTVRMTTGQIANLATGGGGSVVGAISTVNGQTGTVVITATDIGLANVDNTSDQTKNTAAVTLTNKSIDGSQNTLTNIPQGSVTGLTAALGSVVNTAGTGLGLSGNTISLANTAVSPAQYGTVASVPQITVDQQGRITGAVELSLVIPQAQVTGLTASFAAKAPVASPTFTGITTAPVYALTGGTGAATAVRWVGGTTSAAPTTGTWLTGDGVIGTGGKVYICTAGGTPGTWVDAGSGSSGPPTGSAGGDLAGSGSTYPNPVIANGAITLAKQANLAGLSIIGNSSGSAAAPQALNATAVKSLLAITESDVASLAADLAALAPTASPTFTGTATAPTIVGGSGAGASLTLNTSSAGSPTGNMSLFGFGGERIRIRGVEGNVVIGNDPTSAVAGNVTALVRSGTLSSNDVVTTGTAFAVLAGDDNAPTGAGMGAQISWNVQNSPTALQSVALGVLAHGHNTSFTGNLVGLQVQSTDEVGQASGAVFGGNITCNIGRAVAGSVDPNVTSHTVVQGMEIDVNDRAGVYGENTGGYACRLGGAGAWDWTSALLLSASIITQGTFHNAILVPSTIKTNSTGAGKTVTNWTSGVAYTSGTSYVSATDGTKYVCATSHTSTAGGAHPNPISGGNTTDWTLVRPSGLLYAWNSSVQFNMAEIVTNDAGANRWQAKVNSTNVTPAAGATWAAWSSTAGPNQNLLWHGPLSGQNPAGTPITQITAAGDMRLAGAIGENGMSPQALTGWVAPTGTRSRATFDPSTVTLANLATRVCALIVDLMAAGRIG